MISICIENQNITSFYIYFFICKIFWLISREPHRLPYSPGPSHFPHPARQAKALWKSYFQAVIHFPGGPLSLRFAEYMATALLLYVYEATTI